MTGDGQTVAMWVGWLRGCSGSYGNAGATPAVFYIQYSSRIRLPGVVLSLSLFYIL